MKKPSLKDKLLSAATIEEAHKKLTQSTPVATPVPVQPAPPPQQPAPPTPVYQAQPRAQKPRSTQRTTRIAAENYAERNVRITVDMPESLHERVKLHTVLQKQSIRDFILTLVERELARK